MTTKETALPTDDTYLSPRLERWRARTDVPFLVIAIGSLPVLLLELVREELGRTDQIFLDLVNIVVLVVFAVDYLVELALASDRRRYARSEWPSALIVLAQAAALLPSAAGLGAFRALRGARVVRPVATILRSIAVGGAAARQGRSVLRRHAAGFALGVAGLTWLTSAVAFTIVEDVGAHGRLHSFFDALWWSSATITTVGYGDVYPVTSLGRIVGVFTMVAGISTFAVVTAKAAEFLVRTPPPDDDSPE